MIKKINAYIKEDLELKREFENLMKKNNIKCFLVYAPTDFYPIDVSLFFTTPLRAKKAAKIILENYCFDSFTLTKEHNRGLVYYEIECVSKKIEQNGR